LAEYERCYCAPEAIHVACEDCRASATIDLEHDQGDQADKIGCPVHVERGVVGRLFHPIEGWQVKCDMTVTGKSLPAGHFIPEEVPGRLLEEMRAFFC
jgi:haloacetate dehalogenase